MESNEQKYRGLVDRILKSEVTKYQVLFDAYQALLAMSEDCNVRKKGIREYWRKRTNFVKEMCAFIVGRTGEPRFETLRWKVILLEARQRVVDSYFLYLEKKRDDDKKFYEPRRDVFLKCGITQGLQGLIDDDYDILTISMPPGTGKSTAGIFFLSGVMGWEPDMPNLASAHSGILTRSFYDGVLQIISDPEEYTWHEIFPDVIFSSRGDSNSKEQTINVGRPKRFKSLTCRAINASLTGATRCENILYADDLCSGIEEALSKERLDKLWQTYNTDLKTRKKNFCKEIHIATRWSVHDVIGRLARDHDGDPRFKSVSVPALDEHGNSNFMYKHGVGFSTSYFLDMKKSMDDVSFRCLYMNQPIEREGLLYHENEFERYFKMPDREPDQIIGVCDTKDRGADYCFMPIFWQYGDKYYLDGLVYSNDDIEIIDEMIVRTLIEYNPHTIQFESNAAGGRMADDIQKAIYGKCRTQITKKYTTQNKETKIIANSAWIKRHIMLKDPSLYNPQSQYGQMVTALFSYTQMGRNAHDDVPDGLAMFAEMVARGIDEPAIVGRRLW